MAGKKGSMAEFGVKLVLVFFISLLAFSVGTFVGKGFSDSEYRRAALEGETHSGRSTASDETAESSDELTQEEIASLTDEFIESEKKKLQGEPGAEGDHPQADEHDDVADEGAPGVEEHPKEAGHDGPSDDHRRGAEEHRQRGEKNNEPWRILLAQPMRFC